MRIKSMTNAPGLTRIKAGRGRSPGNWRHAISRAMPMHESDHGVADPLDLRELPPPVPMVRSLEAARSLAPGGRTVVLTPCWPLPLFSSLSDAGFEWKASHLPCGGARVEIQRPNVAP